MDNSKKQETKQHKAQHIVGSFLLSKYARKKRYKLCPAKHGILRYIADSIDLYFKKTKKFHAKIYIGQIAKQLCATYKTIWSHIQHLIVKKFLEYNAENNVFELGRLFFAYVKITYPKEVCKNYITLRSMSNLHTSNSSNLTNGKAILKIEKITTAATAKHVSPLLAEFMKSKGKQNG